MLTWHELSREHIRDLAGFTCADPPKPPGYELGRGRPPHKYPHELSVQNHIRGVTPRGNNYDRTIQLGYEGRELVSYVELEVQRGTIPETGEVVGQLLIVCLAVSVGHRGKGCGDAAVIQGLSMAAELDSRYSTGMHEGDSPVPVWAHIRKANTPSQGLLGRHGFVRLWDHEDDPECDVWAYIP